jgi:hypothetical protein
LAGAGGCFVLLLVLFADGEGFSVVFAEGFWQLIRARADYFIVFLRTLTTVSLRWGDFNPRCPCLSQIVLWLVLTGTRRKFFFILALLSHRISGCVVSKLTRTFVGARANVRFLLLGVPFWRLWRIDEHVGGARFRL